MKKIRSIILKMNFFVLFVSCTVNSFCQVKPQKTSIKQPVIDKGTIIISASKSCIITINGVQVDILKDKEVKTISYPVGKVILKGD